MVARSQLERRFPMLDARRRWPTRNLATRVANVANQCRVSLIGDRRLQQWFPHPLLRPRRQDAAALFVDVETVDCRWFRKSFVINLRRIWDGDVLRRDPKSDRARAFRMWKRVLPNPHRN